MLSRVIGAIEMIQGCKVEKNITVLKFDVGGGVKAGVEDVNSAYK